MFFIDIDDRHIVCLFDRKMETAHLIYLQNVPRAFCQGHGTVLDGELIHDSVSESWTFVVFDCIMLASLPKFHKPFRERLRVVRAALELAYRPDPTDTLKLVVKTFVPLEQADPVTLAGDARFQTDGFIFMPNAEAIRFGHHDTFFKLKTCHSVDLLYRRTGLFIYNQRTRRYVKAGVLADTRQQVPLQEGSIVECVLERYDRVPSKTSWRLLHVRHDKNKSNTLFVMEKTLLNVRENLSFETIKALVTAGSS